MGEGAIIAGSSFVTESIPAGARVGVKNQEINVRIPSENKGESKPWHHEDK